MSAMIEDRNQFGPRTPERRIGVAAVRALEEGIIDGFWANGMGAELAVRSGIGKLVFDVRRGDGPPSAFNFTMATLAATEKLVESRPDEMAGAVRAIGAANRILRQDPTKALEVGKVVFPDESDHIVELIRRDVPFYKTHLAPEFVTGMNAFARTSQYWIAMFPMKRPSPPSSPLFWNPRRHRDSWTVRPNPRNV